MSRYIADPERFRIKVMEGWGPAPTFNHRIEYGSMWHVCEEYEANSQLGGGAWERPLLDYCQTLAKQYPLQQEQIDHWYRVCQAQFPLYVNYWAQHKDVTNRKPISQERTFHAPYQLVTGRTVYLRGKRDAVDLIDGKLYLQENKTKGEIHEEQIRRQLTFDLQTMLYLTALKKAPYDSDPEARVIEGDAVRKHQIGGVRYNVVRRPLSGGKGTIVRHKPSKSNPQGESKEAFYDRLAQYIRDEPETYFMRWRIEVSPSDVSEFQNRCLDPLLENLCDDFEWWSYCHAAKCDPFDYVERSRLYEQHTHRHYQHPFGVYNPLDEGGSTDLDEYLRTGSTVGLVRTENLFPELT